jgi:hypothetical protein
MGDAIGENVGVRGWVGLHIETVSDDELEWHVLQAWRLIAPERLQTKAEEH